MKILAMSGFVPEQICDTVRFTQYAGKRRIAHYCGYAADYLSEVLDDESVDGAVFPKSCDSSRVLSGYLDGCGKFVYQFHIPVWGAAGACEFYASELRAYQRAVETYYGIEITDIEDRVVAVNERNQALRHLYDNLDCISYYEYLKQIHELLQLPLHEQHVDASLAPIEASGRRVFLAGSFLSNAEVVRELESAGLNIVADSITESGRMVSRPPVSIDGDLYESIAGSILADRISPTQQDFKRIIKADMSEIERKSVEGVVFVTQKYCEPYDYLFPVYKKALESHDIPIMRVTLDDSTDRGKVAISAEAFAETLAARRCL